MSHIDLCQSEVHVLYIWKRDKFNIGLCGYIYSFSDNLSNCNTVKKKLFVSSAPQEYASVCFQGSHRTGSFHPCLVGEYGPRAESQ